MKNILQIAIIRKNKILIGKLKESIRRDYGGIRYMLPGGEVTLDTFLNNFHLNKERITKISERIHPVSKLKLIYYIYKTNSTNLDLSKNSKYFKDLSWIKIKDINKFIPTLYTKVHAEIIKNTNLKNKSKFKRSLNYLDQNIEKYAGIIQSGNLVAFPTETVYGIGANAYDTNAVKKIFKIKKRPVKNPIIVHIASIKDLDTVTKDVPEQAMRLAEAFWPGPLTIISNKNQLIPDIVTAGLDTVAVRNPNNAFALELIQLSKVPIAAPSANLSGRPSATHHRYIEETFNNKLPVLKAGKSLIGVESTVVNVTEKNIQILRQGGIPREKIEKVIGKVKVYVPKPGNCKKPISPGMMYRHYAPDTKLELIPYSVNIRKDFKNKIDKYTKQNKKVGVICTREYEKLIPHEVITEIIGSKNNLKYIAQNIFKSLIEIDKKGLDIILCQSFPERMLGGAVMDRLRRASSDI